MKKITIYLSAILTFALSGCADWLDIRPENEVVLEDYWKTESQATAVLSSCYRGLILNECVERMLVWGEVRSDNVQTGNSKYDELTKVLNTQITPTNPYANWASFYQVINYCNTFLHFAPDVVKSDPNFTETKLHTMEAEALTIRALCYFYLVRTFKEVPLILEPSINDTQDYSVAKSTEREILDQIIADLLIAQKTARADYGVGAYNKGRVTVNAVNALLADVYLWDQQYAKCVENCDKIINNQSFQLVDGDKLTNLVFFAGNSKESIFELQFDKDVQWNNTANNFLGSIANPQGLLSVSNFISKAGTYSPYNYAASATKESVKDIREKTFHGPQENGDGFVIYKYALIQCTEKSTGEYEAVYRNSSTPVNWILYRLADIILMKAEASVELNKMDEALRLVNRTYLRSNLTADSLQIANYGSKADMEKLVLRERQRELMFEGKRWFDLMRLVRRKGDPTTILAYLSPKLTGGNMQIKKMSVMNALYMPILKSELEINPKLTQNPFYEDSEFMN